MEQAARKKAFIYIEGMHCSSCAATIEGVLKKIKGVSEAEVLFTTGKARVVFDPAKAKTSDFSRAIQALGYTVMSVKEL